MPAAILRIKVILIILCMIKIIDKFTKDSLMKLRLWNLFTP